MNREYHDGTEPTSLPHFVHCSGPCDQGRSPCPCPMACEREVPNADELGVFEMIGKFIVVVLAFVGLGALVGWLT